MTEPEIVSKQYKLVYNVLVLDRCIQYGECLIKLKPGHS